MADCLLIKIFEAYIKNNSNSDLTLVPGKELLDVSAIKNLLDTAIKFYKPKKQELETFESCRELRDLFNINASQAKTEWDKIVKEAQQEYDNKFITILDIKDLSLYTEADVNQLQSQLPFWTEEYIIQKLGSKFIDYGKPAKIVIKEDPFFSRWSTIVTYLKKCKEYLEKEYKITFSESVMSWMDILRYWKFISPLYENNEPARKECVYTGFDTTTMSGLSRLYQKFGDIFRENRSNSSLNGREYQKELEEISKFLRDCCESVERFNGYKLRLEKANHESLVQTIMYLVNMKTKVISNFNRAVEIAKSANVSDPELFVKQVLSENKISIPTEFKSVQSSSRSKTQRCPNCSSNIDEDLSICPKCGYTISIQCPNPRCNKTINANSNNCPYCRTPIGYSNANVEIESAKESLRNNDLVKCGDFLNKAKALFSSHPEIEIIQKQLNNAIIQSAKDALRKNDLKNCEKFLNSAKSTCPDHPDIDLIQNQLNNKIILLIKEALRTGDLINCEKYLNYALSISPNNQELKDLQAKLNDVKNQKVEQELAKYLNNLNVNDKITVTLTTENNVKIYWSECPRPIGLPASKKITYWVIRKNGAVPSTNKDGVIIEKTSNCYYEDTTIEPGRVYGYTVFPAIDNIPHVKCYTGNKIMAPCGVTGLKHIPSDRSVQLLWELPKYATGVHIYRKLGSSIANAGEGVLIESRAVSGDSPCNGYTDSNVQPNATYSYWVVPVFLGVTGKQTEGIGRSIDNCHTSPIPQPVTDLKYTKSSNEIEFTWTPEKTGSVKLYISSSPLGSQNDIKPIKNSVFARATAITQCDSQNGKAVFRGTITNVQFITPITFNSYYGVIGKAIKLVNMHDVANVTLTRTNGKIYLSWNWEPTDKEFLVLFKNEEYPASPNDRDANFEYFTLQSYKANENAYIVNAVGNENYFFAIYRIGEDRGKKIFSEPARIRSIGKKINIHYRFFKKKKYIFWGQEHLYVHIESSDGHIPELILIKNNNELPQGRDNGITFLNIPASNKPSCDLIINRQLEKGTYIKLFIKEESQADLYDLYCTTELNNMRI